MSISLDHAVLKADPNAAARALRVTLSSKQHNEVGANGRVVRMRTLEAKLPRVQAVRARFVREGLLERAKKLFVDEVEVGSAWFDDHIFVVTSTKEATASFLARKRVQQALIMLVDATRQVDIEGDSVRVIDEHAPDDGRDATAELLALAAHLLSCSIA